MKEKAKEIKNMIIEEEYKSCKELTPKPKKRIAKSQWLKNLSTERKKSKAESKKYLDHQNYQIRKNYNECMLNAMRLISDKFPLNAFAGIFKFDDPAIQIKIAQKCLKEFAKKEMVKVGSFTGSFEMMKSVCFGSNLVFFNGRFGAHVEAIINKQEDPDMEEWMVEDKVLVNTFEWYQVMDVEN